MLRDRIVRGINDAQTQKCLLAKKNFTYAKAREIASALETALQGSKDIQSSLAQDPVYKVSQQQTVLGISVQCFCCSVTNHKAPQCQFKDAVYSYFKKKEHLAKTCCSKQSGLKDRLLTHLVAEESVEHDDE